MHSTVERSTPHMGLSIILWCSSKYYLYSCTNYFDTRSSISYSKVCSIHLSGVDLTFFRPHELLRTFPNIDAKAVISLSLQLIRELPVDLRETLVAHMSDITTVQSILNE